MGVFVLAQQLDTAIWPHPATWVGLGTALLAASATRIRQAARAPHRRPAETPATRPTTAARHHETAGKE